MSDSTPNSSGLRGLFARIAGSAEYSIAAALLVVCFVVGGALWWLRPQEALLPPSVAGSTSTPAVPEVDERAAVDDWKRRLGEEFGAIDEQQRQRAAEEEARRMRQRAQEAAVAEARRQAELAAQARQQAEIRRSEQAAIARAAVLPPPPHRRVVVTEAAIDWSSCKRPSYPELSVRRGEEGVVVAAVDLDAAARIQQVRLAQSSGHERLDRVTLDAIRKCRFAPAREDGVAQAATAQVRFNWQLKD